MHQIDTSRIWFNLTTDKSTGKIGFDIYSDKILIHSSDKQFSDASFAREVAEQTSEKIVEFEKTKEKIK